MDLTTNTQFVASAKDLGLKQMKIQIETHAEGLLSETEIKYVFETLCTTMGVPWHFVPAHYQGEVHIYYGGERSRSNAELNILMETNTGRQPERKVVSTSEKNLVFLDFFGQTSSSPLEYDSGGQLRRINNDIIYTLFDLLTGGSEKGVPRNRWDIHEIQQTFLYQQQLLHVPIVDQYAQLLKQTFSDRFNFLSKWPDGKKIAVVLSHDTDYPEMIRPIEALKYTLREKRIDIAKLREIWNGTETFWKFDEWMQLEGSFNTRSAFYICPFQGSLLRYFLIAPDTFYNIRKKKYKEIAARLVQHGFEVGLHASFNAYKSLQAFKGEVEKLGRVLDVVVSGNRHHYWHLNQDNPAETAEIHEQAGLTYDSSIAYDRHSGFRYSICTPFHLFSRSGKKALSILQLPPTLMDDQLFGCAPLTRYSSYQEHIDDLVRVIYQYQGIFVADFHTRVLNETFFPEWKSAYRYMLEKLTEHQDFYNDTPQNITRYWLEREHKLKTASLDENGHSNQ